MDRGSVIVAIYQTQAEVESAYAEFQVSDFDMSKVSIISGIKSVFPSDGLGLLGVGLHSLGIPKASISRYEAAAKNDKFVLIVNCSMQETSQVREIIHRSSAESLEQHQSMRKFMTPN